MPPILKRGIQPSDFPQMVCVAIILMTLYMFWRDPVTIVEPMGERSFLRLIMVGLVVPVTVFFLFDQVFKIRFPRGLLTNLWYG